MITKRTAGPLASAIVASMSLTNVVGAASNIVSLEQAGLTRHWSLVLPLLPDEVVRGAFLVDEALYVTTTNGTLFSIQANVGLVRWGVRVTEPGYTILRPSHVQTPTGGGPTLVTTTDSYLVMDRHSGDVVQRFHTEFPATCTALGRDQVVFVGGADELFYSLLRPRLSEIDPILRWKVQIARPVTARPTLWNGTELIFASRGGRVYSCRASDKALNWSFRTGGPIKGDPFVDAGGVYVASMDRSLYKLDVNGGQLMWRLRLPCELERGPVVSAGTVFQYCEDRGLFAVDSDSGEQRWQAADAVNFVSHAKGRDVLFALDGTLHVVDSATGTLLKRADAHPAVMALENTGDDAVYLIGSMGQITCAYLETVPYLRLQQVLAAKEQLNRPLRTNPCTTIPETKIVRPIEDPFRSIHDKP